MLSFGADVFGMDIAFLARIDAEAGGFEVVAQRAITN